MLDTLRSTWRFAPKVCSTLIALLGLAACVPMQSADDGDSDSDSSDDGDSDDGDSDSGDSSGTSSGGPAGDDGDACNEVLTCIVACPDDACANACYANGSSGAQQKIDALIGCLNESLCQDPECAKMACGAEIDACVQDVSAPDQSTPPVTQGMVPTELVGDWLGARGSYHFEPDGSYWFVGILSSDGPCIAFEQIVFTDEGVASTSGNTLTLTAEMAKQETHDCGGAITTKMNPGHTNQYTWSINGITLTLVGNDTGPIEYTKQ